MSYQCAHKPTRDIVSAVQGYICKHCGTPLAFVPAAAIKQAQEALAETARRIQLAADEGVPLLGYVGTDELLAALHTLKGT